MILPGYCEHKVWKSFKGEKKKVRFFSVSTVCCGHSMQCQYERNNSDFVLKWLCDLDKELPVLQ